MLQDPAKKAYPLQKLGLEDPAAGQGAKQGRTPAGTSGGKSGSESTGHTFPQTPCGTFMGFGPGGMVFPPVFTGVRLSQTGNEQYRAGTVPADAFKLRMGLPHARSLSLAVWARTLRC